MRIALCRKRRDGRFDWELGEFVHSVAAAKAGATVPAVLGYGYRSARFGLPRETVLLSEWLEGYTDLRAWMSANPDGVVGMTRRIIQLVMRLIELRIIHLDLWIGNILSPLLPPKIVDENMPMVVDWENAWIWDVPYPAQAMGYMLGFLFHYELQCHLDEAAFDALVLEALAAMPQLDRPAFETIYTFAKHHHISRKTRWRIVTEGRLP
jgi:hypothetical protein